MQSLCENIQNLNIDCLNIRFIEIDSRLRVHFSFDEYCENS